MSNKPRVFVAGATGAVGRIMCQLLVTYEYEIFGLTRNVEKVESLESIGVRPVVADVYNKQRIVSLFKSIQPNIVIHQLTDLPFGLPSEKMKEGRIANAKIRDIGTKNLVLASQESEVTRFIVQSVAFMYKDGSLPHTEDAPLASDALRNFEDQVLERNFEGIVLRYGRFYGPRTGFDIPKGSSVVHVDAAAQAAILAIFKGKKGIYNIVEDENEVLSRKAKQELGWDPNFRS